MLQGKEALKAPNSNLAPASRMDTQRKSIADEAAAAGLAGVSANATFWCILCLVDLGRYTCVGSPYAATRVYGWALGTPPKRYWL